MCVAPPVRRPDSYVFELSHSFLLSAQQSKSRRVRDLPVRAELTQRACETSDSALIVTFDAVVIASLACELDPSSS